VITRKRSMIPPSVTTRQSHSEYLSVPPATHRIRKAQSDYADGSPTPRHASRFTDRTSALQLSNTPVREHLDGYGGNLATLSNFGEPHDYTASSLASQGPSIRETQTDEQILSMARDKCLQDFQQKKLRERKSLFLAPFQKRRASGLQKSSESGYDLGLPPFNYADDKTMAPLPPAREPISSSLMPTLKVEKKSRNFSDTLKGRIKKAFRKASKAPAELPVQHVEAKHFHYAASEEAYHSLSEKHADPFLTFDETPAVPSELKSSSANSRESAAQHSDARSRVTSWANSTVAGTCASRYDSHPLPTSTEHGKLKRSGSQSTLRNATSFFGRPVMNKLRKPSKAQLNNSEESQGLYLALHEHIQPPKRTPTPSQLIEEVGVPRLSVTSALATLPSQQQTRETVSRASKYSTVRTVTPDLTARKPSICSPVAEVLSPGIAAPNVTPFITQEAKCSDTTPRSGLQHRQATKAPTPSPEQIAHRMQKSKNRWQSPLDELSPAMPRSTRATMMDDNPYELRSLSQSHHQPPATNDLPHHAKVNIRDPTIRADMLSPSVYSRATDGASPRPETPTEPVGTFVTITSREVRSYSISPPKEPKPEPQKPTQTSGQWRRWLSDEMNGFKAGLEHLSLTQNLTNDAQHTLTGLMKNIGMSQETAAHDDYPRPASASPPLLNACPSSVATTTRPRASSQRSSFMNERFPMMDTGRNSSDRSIGSRNASRTGERSVNNNDQGSQSAVNGSGGDGHAQKNSLGCRRVVTGRQSIAQMQTAARSRSALGSYDSAEESITSGAPRREDREHPAASSEKTSKATECRLKVSNRHKSAFELRANYKNSTTGRSTPLKIHRKHSNDNNNNDNDMLGDSTIRDISAGPYASHQLSSTTVSWPAYRGDDKENITPSAETSSLPALSSSEWLAAGPNKSRKPSAVHPALRNRSVSRYSPIRATNHNGGQKEGKGCAGSPGQRLAGEWLEKRSRENTPAFM